MTQPYDAVFWDIGGVVLDLDSVPERGHRAFVEILGERSISARTRSKPRRDEPGAHFRDREGTAFASARAGYARAVSRRMVGHEVAENEWLPAFERARPPRPSSQWLKPSRPSGGSTADSIRASSATIDTCRLRLIRPVPGRRPPRRDDHLRGSRSNKPDPVMFETALEKAGVAPNER